MSLLTARTVQLIKTVIFRLEFIFIFLKNFLKQTEKSFNTTFHPHFKFEGVWGELEVRNVSRENHSQNIYD